MSSSVDLSRLTAIVYANAAPRSVDRMVASFRRFYPTVKLLAADDSREPRTFAGADKVKLPKDVGAGAARNSLLAWVRTPYFLLIDAAAEFTRRTRIESLVDAVASGRVDLAAADFIGCKKKLFLFTSRTPVPGHATFEFEADTLKVLPGARPGSEGVLPCDMVHHFFVARTDKVRAMGGWDPQLMVDGEVEFFVRARRFNVRVGVVPQVVARHWANPSSATARRGRDFQGLAVAKMGVARLIDAEGRLHEAAAHVQMATRAA